MAQKKYEVIVVGGGTGGIMIASQLKRRDKDIEIALIEPSKIHYYQPAFTLVGAGTYKMKNTMRSTKKYIPEGVEWLQDWVVAVDAKNKQVKTEKLGSLSYDYLILSPGLVYDNSLIEGLDEALDKGVVCSNYIDPEYTWESLQKFQGGNMIFTLPATPIKCGGAPQKAMYLSADYIRKKGLKDTTNIIFPTPGSVVFGVAEIAKTLNNVLDRYDVHFKPRYTPVKIDSNEKIVYFQYGLNKKEDVILEERILKERWSDDELIAIPFDFLHIAPPSVAPDFIRKSDLTNKDGWVDVNIHSLQHKKYETVFALGDVAALPTAKTGAAIRKQVPVIVDNIMELRKGAGIINYDYDGYSSCPLVTGYNKMVLAEFNYNNEFTPDSMLKWMLIKDSSKEDIRLWWLKKYLLPFMYWNRMLKGKM